MVEWWSVDGAYPWAYAAPPVTFNRLYLHGNYQSCPSMLQIIHLSSSASARVNAVVIIEPKIPRPTKRGCQYDYPASKEVEVLYRK